MRRARPTPPPSKAFSLLLTVLSKRKLHALVRVAMRGPARYALLDAQGNLFLVHTADAVRGPLEVTKGKHSEAELNLAEALVDAVGIDAPVLMDTTAPVVLEFVNQKAKGIAPAPVAAAPAIPVDIMSQLLASIDATKAKAVS